ncbi:MAG: squalene/phytoene synthase family protein [Pseudomonadota bacterium]
MAINTLADITDEARLALAYTPPIMRNALRIFLEFDARLARIVSATNEPMLGQVRLAWWRDTLGMDVSERPTGDAVLDAVGEEWVGREDALIALVDGWEQMLSEPPLSRKAASAYADGRAVGLASLAALAGGGAAIRDSLEAAGRLWALADAASHVAPGEERDTLISIAREAPRPRCLPAPYKGIAVLAALSERALKAGGAPLMAGRGAAIVAWRAGLLGR